MDRFKKIIKSVLLFGTIFLLTACNRAERTNIAKRIERSDSPVITWGVKADTNLFGYYNIEEQEIQGFDVDIAKALTDVITDGKGRAEFVEVTSKTRIQLLKNGNIDAICATMTASPERAEVVDFSDIYYDAGQNLLVPEDSPITGLDSLKEGDRVLAIKGSTSAKNIREKAPQVTVLEMENYSEGFVALQSGQGEALTTDSAILLGMMDQVDGYRLAGENFTDEPYGIAIDKTQKEFLELVNNALSEIRENGTYYEIYDKWFAHLESRGATGDDN